MILYLFLLVIQGLLVMNSNPIASSLRRFVDEGSLAGLAACVWRGGKVVNTTCLGWRDRETALPVKQNTLFRIASMSKPITSVAALLAWEEGKFALSDPIARWAPEFSNMRVLRSTQSPLTDVVPAERPITFEDLLTHRSGLTYGSFHPGPIAKAFDSALGGDIDSHVAPDDWIRALASLPLIDQPGRAFHYGHSTDLLGLLIARIEDAPLGEVMERRIFRPLGMPDTGFTVPKPKHARRAKLYGFDENDRLIPRLTVSGGATLAERPEHMTFVSGGQGLWSTLDDYARFARVFLGARSAAAVQLLRPETLALMTSNQLNLSQRSAAKLLGANLFATGHGFGMGVAVVLDPNTAPAYRCRGGLGTVGWPGAFGGWWQADPTDDSVMIFLAHNIVDLEQLSRGVGLGAFAAIEQFHTSASQPAPT
jgi:CubicO group peptidase (beta-lactamase class C family)